ncbi:MAG: NAD(P)-dependent alcohol dehydrogenase [Bacteroidetes bacterium]|nr:NAD(P)-dependent alcohol dehydrogenase [Bacteroidota bacterium]
MKINAFAAQESGATLQPFSFESNPPKAGEVLVKLTHCGICHSDLHLIDNDWRASKYPLVPGHEAIGTVIELGEQVPWLQLGQTVGIGWQAGSCGYCEWCVQGQEQLCSKNVATCNGRYGGFADHLLVDARFAFPIPAALAPENAAPLLCGGITVYSPLRNYDVRHWHKVAVVGIGGLGHLAIQFASAMGCEVWALSHSANKENEAKTLGAHHFVATSDPNSLKALRGSLDFILVTATADLDWKPYVAALRPNGRICFVTGHATQLDVPASALLANKGILGSQIGGRALMQEMLEFAARKGIVAKTEVMPLANVNAALDKVRDGSVRYRMVLKMGN